MITLFGERDNRILLNAILLQSSIRCKHQCQGCYTRAQEAKNPDRQSDYFILLGFIRNLVQGKGIAANQICISLDTLIDQELEQQRQFFLELLCIFKKYQRSEWLPELALTAHDLSLLGGKGPLNFPSGNHLRRYINHISLSSYQTTTDSPRAILEDLGYSATLNYNQTLGLFKAGDLQEPLGSADFVYLNLHKPPLGEEYPIITSSSRRLNVLPVNQIVSIQSQLESLKKVKSNYEDAWTEGKIIQDHCLTDSLASGCGANISKVTVWPDGAVSGCPYALEPQTGPANSADEIVENIRKSLVRNGGHYSFEDCKISETLVNLTRVKLGLES